MDKLMSLDPSQQMSINPSVSKPMPQPKPWLGNLWWLQMPVTGVQTPRQPMPTQQKPTAWWRPLPPAEFQALIKKAEEDGQDGRAFYKKMVDAWYSLQKEAPKEKKSFAQKVDTAKDWMLWPIVRAGDAVVDWFVGLAEWFSNAIFDGTKDMVHNIGDIWRDDSLDWWEKFAKTIIGEVALWWIGEWIGETLGWWVMWLAEWFTTEEEKVKVKAKFTEKVTNFMETDMAKWLIEDYNKMSPEQQKEISSILEDTMNLLDLAELWAWAVITKWVKKAVTPATQAFLGRVQDVATTAKKTVQEWMQQWSELMSRQIPNIPMMGVNMSNALPSMPTPSWLSKRMLEAGEQFAKNTVDKTKEVANRWAKKLIDSKLKITNTHRGKIQKASGQSAEDFILENNIIGWSTDEMSVKTDELIDKAMRDKFEALDSVKDDLPITKRDELIANSIIRNAKNDVKEIYWVDFDDIDPKDIVPEMQSTFNIIKRLEDMVDSWNATASQKEALKSLFDTYNSHLKYDLSKRRILSSSEKIRLGLQKEIENVWSQIWVDINALNKKIAWWYALNKALEQAGNRLANRNVFGLWDSQAAIFGAVLSWNPVATAWIIGMKKLGDNLWFRTKLANSIYTKWLNNAKVTNTNANPRPTARGNVHRQFDIERPSSTPNNEPVLGLPHNPEAISFWVPKAQLWNAPSNKFQVKETGMENVSQPMRWQSSKWVKNATEWVDAQSALNKVNAEQKPTKTSQNWLKKKDPSTNTPKKTMDKKDYTINPNNEAEVIQFAKDNADEIIAEYKKIIKAEWLPDGYINPDDMRPAFNKVFWQELLATQNHEWVSTVAKLLFKKIANETENAKWLIIAWWPWSGKWWVLKLPDIKVDDYAIIVDKVWPIKELNKMIDWMMDADWVFVDTKVNDALDRALKRTIRWNEQWVGAWKWPWLWRVVNFKSVVAWHAKARKTTKEAFNLEQMINSWLFKKLSVMIADNKGKPWSMSILPANEMIENLKRIDVDLQSASIEWVTKEAKKALNNGDITQSQYDAMVKSLMPILIMWWAAMYLQTEWGAV